MRAGVVQKDRYWLISSYFRNGYLNWECLDHTVWTPWLVFASTVVPRRWSLTFLGWGNGFFFLSCTMCSDCVMRNLMKKKCILRNMLLTWSVLSLCTWCALYLEHPILLSISPYYLSTATWAPSQSSRPCLPLLLQSSQTHSIKTYCRHHYVHDDI